ncbi:MAG TPA: hypothetical protein ENI80_03900 [Acidiferrobacteraceae bacterium]|nr:hypothetical protein [Acidiferrobacteraceae bacterium]
MADYFETVQFYEQWLSANKSLLGMMGLVSFLTVLVSVLVLPVVVSRIHPAYFAQGRKQYDYPSASHPAVRILLLTIKNIVGIFFIGMGVAMLVLPGPGIITMLAGIMLARFPGKRVLERWMIGLPGILRSANWIRRRRGVAPLLHPKSTVLLKQDECEQAYSNCMPVPIHKSCQPQSRRLTKLATWLRSLYPSDG